MVTLGDEGMIPYSEPLFISPSIKSVTILENNNIQKKNT